MQLSIQVPGNCLQCYLLVQKIVPKVLAIAIKTVAALTLAIQSLSVSI